jgi:hypothetical protein
MEMPAREKRLLFAAAVGMGVLLLAAALAGHPHLLAYAGPLWLLTLPLIAGRYVGEEALVRLRRDRPVRRRPLASRALPKGARRVAALLPRGGSLIAEALAVRPPPLPRAT